MEINKIMHGNCLDVMKTLPDNCIDAIVTDPPYGISFMGKKWDYDVPSQEIREECLRILKPGGYLLAFAGTRTQHRMAVRIEDAGFEIRDMIAWVYGSGFPKSLNIGKAVDKLQGNEREVSRIRTDGAGNANSDNNMYDDDHKFVATKVFNETKGTSEWEGWGTALKPALEPITVARKPLGEKTVAENVLKWGTGGINIDGCRVETSTEDIDKSKRATIENRGVSFSLATPDKQGIAVAISPLGRFPANLIHDGSDEVVDLFPNTKSGGGKTIRKNEGAMFDMGKGYSSDGISDSGSASRFFYCAKASKSERNKGLDGHKLISIMGVVLSSNDPLGTTEKPDQSQLHLLDIEVSQLNEGGGCEIKIKKGKDLSISLYEKLKTDQYLNDYKSIIKTTTNGTMSLKTLNWLLHCITKEYTLDVNGGIEFGENLVENVEGGQVLKTIMKGNLEYLLGVKNAVSEMQLIIKEKGNSNFHSTVKPIALMEYLVKLVTKEGALVLDPFAGSGSTLIACKNLNRNYIGIELTEEYIPIIEARLK